MSDRVALASIASTRCPAWVRTARLPVDDARRILKGQLRPASDEVPFILRFAGSNHPSITTAASPSARPGRIAATT
jgi:hypothetical protein